MDPIGRDKGSLRKYFIVAALGTVALFAILIAFANSRSQLSSRPGPPNVGECRGTEDRAPDGKPYAFSEDFSQPWSCGDPGAFFRFTKIITGDAVAAVSGRSIEKTCDQEVGFAPDRAAGVLIQNEEHWAACYQLVNVTSEDVNNQSLCLHEDSVYKQATSSYSECIEYMHELVGTFFPMRT
jgi:hypothetical protein